MASSEFSKKRGTGKKGDGNVLFSLRHDDTSEDRVMVEFSAGAAQLLQQRGGAWDAALDSDNTVTSSLDTAYTVYVLAYGDGIEVYREDLGEDVPVLAATGVAVRSGPKVSLGSTAQNYTHYDNVYARAGSTDLRSFSDDFGALSLDAAWQTASGTWTLDTANGEIDSSGTTDDVLGRELQHSDAAGVATRPQTRSGGTQN